MISHYKVGAEISQVCSATLRSGTSCATGSGMSKTATSSTFANGNNSTENAAKDFLKESSLKKGGDRRIGF